MADRPQQPNLPGQSPDARRIFTPRVEDYLRYRPRYPQAVIATLREECGLDPEHVVVDVGSGTGFLSELFLQHGNPVIGVEPNSEMRAAAERYLSFYSGFTSVDGSAESTGLRDASADFVTAGTAFHWFEPAEAAAEFKRILRPRGCVVLVWNALRLDTSAFSRDYEAAVRNHAPDYPSAGGADLSPPVLQMLFGAPVRSTWFYNAQHVDLDGMIGRTMSSSWAPDAGTPARAALVTALGGVFARHAGNGQVAFEYDCFVTWIRLAGR